jgi:hypothetical protein
MLEKISCTTQKIQTSTGSRRITDTNYSSNLSKEFVVSKLSVKNTASNLTIYIGEPKLNGYIAV